MVSFSASQLFVPLTSLLLVFTSGIGAQYFGTPYCRSGRDVIVQLFEWKWTDIEKECSWLAINDFCAVLVSPPNEHRVVTEPSYPWWQRYEPVSYKMGSRSGTEAQFRQMVKTCNNIGVFVYVDAVFNHMTTNGTGVGSDGSNFNGDAQLYPPYLSRDFNGASECPTSDLEIADYNNSQQVRNCRKSYLRDLKTGSSFVRDRISTYLNDLIWWGVAGFRIDSADHIWPADIFEILIRTIPLSTSWFPPNTRPYIFQQVVDAGDRAAISASDYTPIGRVTDYRNGKYIGDVLRKNNGLKLADLSNYGVSGWLNSRDALVFIDNHESQRGLVPGGFEGWLSFYEFNAHKIAHVFQLAWPYGHVLVFSGYFWLRNIVNGVDQNRWVGPPSDPSGNTVDVICFNGDWMCEHRWLELSNMVKFHNAALGQPVSNWWDNGGNAIAFSRGNRAFIAINNENFPINSSFQTGLPAGEYCDVLSCDRNRPPCGNSEGNCRPIITVDTNGFANINIPDGENPMIALYN